MQSRGREKTRRFQIERGPITLTVNDAGAVIKSLPAQFDIYFAQFDYKVPPSANKMQRFVEGRQLRPAILGGS